jgi:hypothetical protein
MQLCPVSIAIGCAKCPVVKVCPGKNVIGDAKKSTDEKEKKNQEK